MVNISRYISAFVALSLSSYIFAKGKFAGVFSTLSLSLLPVWCAGALIMELSKARSLRVIEHPVFFYMPGLSNEPDAECKILQGLSDLQFSNFSDLHFLYAGRVNQSSGVAFTHALISRFPTVEALQVYYNSAITDIAKQMGPWLQREFCADYEVSLPNDEILLNGTGNLAFHVTFIKVKSNASTTDIDNIIQSFLGLADELDYVTQLTAGENLCMRESYRTISHAFSAYFPSVEALEKWQEERAFLSVLNDKILPMAQSYASVALVPFVAQSVAAS